MAVAQSGSGQSAERSNGVALADGRLREAVASLREGRSPRNGVETVGERVRVEVRYEGLSDGRAPRQAIAGLGGRIEGEIDGWLIQALVPFRKLEQLEARNDVRFLEAAVPVDAPTDPPQQVSSDPGQVGTLVGTGEHVSLINADDWHTAGHTGAGIKVGIIDSFSQTKWDEAQAGGEVPAPVATRCIHNGTLCNIWGDSVHGLGVAEVIYDMAPGVQFYLGAATSKADYDALIDWFAANGVKVINRSLGGPLDGPGNGTGPLATVVDRAVAKGMVFAQSAGNHGGPEGQLEDRRGAYYRHQGFQTRTRTDGWSSRTAASS